MLKFSFSDLVELAFGEPVEIKPVISVCALESKMHVQARRSKNGWLDFIWRIRTDTGEFVAKKPANKIIEYYTIRTTWKGGELDSTLWSVQTGYMSINFRNKTVPFTEIEWTPEAVNRLLHTVVETWFYVQVRNPDIETTLKKLLEDFRKVGKCDTVALDHYYHKLGNIL